MRSNYKKITAGIAVAVVLATGAVAGSVNVDDAANGLKRGGVKVQPSGGDLAQAALANGL